MNIPITIPRILKIVIMTILSITIQYSSYSQNPADACASAVQLTVNNSCSTTGFLLAGTYANAGHILSGCQSSDRDDGWYYFTGTGGMVTVESSSSDQRHVLGLYSGTCATLSLIKCEEVTIGNSARLTVATTAATTYYIQIQRTSGNFTANLNGSICVYSTPVPGGITSGIGSWYSADGKVITTGTTVNQWQNNIGGSPNAVSQVGDPEVVVNSVNFNPAIVFDGNDYLYGPATGTNFIGANTGTLIMINNYHSGAVITKWEQTGTPGNRTAKEGMGTNIRYDHPTDASHIINTTAAANVWLLSTGLASNTNDYMYVNGRLEGSDVGGTNTPGAAGSIMFGANTDGSWPATTDIAEVIFYTTTLSAADRNKVESALAAKYGITLGTTASPVNYTASTGLIYWTGSGTYQNDIAGIGRDDNGNLSQKKSKSVNSDGIVTMALTDLGGNFGSPDNFNSNLEFLMWGNDNGSTVESALEVPSGYSRRIPREWKIQETGTVGNAAIQLDISALTLSGTILSDFALIIDEDGDGNFTTGTIRKIVPNSYVGGVLQFNGVDFANGEVFSLATLAGGCGPGGVSTNLAFWLNAGSQAYNNAGTTLANDGDGVYQWQDLSGNDFHAVQTTAVNRPVYNVNAFNFNPAVNFTEGSDYYNLSAYASSIITKTNTIFGVGDGTGTNEDFMLYASDGTGGAAGIGYDGFSHSTFPIFEYHLGFRATETGMVFNQDGAQAGASNVETTESHTSAKLLSNYYQASTGLLQLGMNGNAMNSGTAPNGGFAVNHMFIGSHAEVTGSNLPSRWFNGDIAEIIVFNSILSASDMLKVQSYLALKYGITLGSTAAPVNYTASDGTIFWTGDAIFQNDVTGIGRDDASCLSQPKSKSVNTDGILAIALTDNGGTFDAPNGFDNNLEFFTWGNDNGAINSTGVSDIDGTIIVGRLERIWTAQETGVIGNLTLQFDLSTAPGLKDLTHLRLLIDRDGDGFSDNDVAPVAAASLVGNIVTFIVDLQDGDMFTVGTTNNVTPLPIEFIDLGVQKGISEYVVTWVTGEITNSSHFEVLRSTNGNTWDVIGEVLIDKSITSTTYTYSDKDVSGNKVYYYRIKEIGNNGGFSYSHIVSTSGNLLVGLEFQVYPNPAKHWINIQLGKTPSSDAPVELRIYSIEGMVLHIEQLNEQKSTIDLRSIPPGTYFIELRSVNGVHPERKIIMIE